jgi:UDP-N-acetylglucosamine diphosphorylase / glucose-1-phosphate thymidylyltransferase / UDP-N-acetylgalactosamine diphosphorylase / glucosamine-1-phosphate N-acetyltransferase / galactosamine-1-phosphate N-acetyltransferase
VIRTAAILARGLGTRMRRDDASARVDATQAAVASSGVKGMIPIGGASSGRAARPFLDFLLSALADVGVTDVVLVLGPEHEPVREYYTREAPPQRVRVRFATQAEPLGTANAVVAAAASIDEDTFLVLNADNYYPREALENLVQGDRAATIAFDRVALVRGGNIDPERVRAFAVLTVTEDGRLERIVEKPGDSLDLASDAARWVGMNCWAITPALVDACRRVPRSARGEFELPEAVGLALREGVAVHAARVALPVLDLSQRADIAAVAEALALVEVRP